MGDGIMALFGAPLAHEDHAVRACYAALRMQEAVKRYAELLRRSDGVTVHIRVGLNSGEVVVRAIGSDLHMDYTAVGGSTHLAARMEQLAVPGSVLITADTLRLAEGYVEVKPLGPVRVKGLAEPIEAYEVAGAGAVRTRLQASAVRGLTRFVGRDEEMEQLRRALEAAHAGRGQVAAVVGEPGVGKSRLFVNIRQWRANLANRLPSDAFGALSIPTTVVVSERANRVARLIGEPLRRLIPNSALIEIPGADHSMVHTHAAVAATIVSQTVLSEAVAG
jgi:pimeloyl-ACP methyl ester carboxylesterase